MSTYIEESLERLRSYCEDEQFMGWDPYDGLNSKVFKSLPGIRSSSLARLAWIQAFKRNPLNLRRLLLIEKDYNPKGLGLFLSGYCNLYRNDPREEYLETIRRLTDLIIKSISSGYSGACWGYNFDWQARAFFQPAGTPTVVATTFIGYALYDAFEILKEEKVRDVAHSTSAFILNDLNRTYDNDGDFCFSYSPLDHSQVFNATLLGSRMLARTYGYTNDRSLLDEARRSVNFCMKHQHENGSWPYSTLPYHQWIDSFHTGYNLECISAYQHYTGERSYEDALQMGFKFYMDNFFLKDGRCKYFHNALYPVDIHSSAQFIITLNRLNYLEQNKEQAEKVIRWTITNMQDRKGFFYFQIRKRIESKIPYIRWAQAWMFYALSDYILYEGRDVSNSF